MEVSKEITQLGDRIAFVLPAYVFVFGIWSGAASYDYISGKWQTVASARRRGISHLFALIIPMVYMVVYIKVQHDAADAKELSAGIIALVFAWVEFCRTVVGLWQLHVFRHWAATSTRSLASLGYVAKKGQGDIDDEATSREAVDTGHDYGETAEKGGSTGHERRSALEIADSLIINDLVVDNRLSEGEVQCLLRMRKRESFQNWRQKVRSSWRWLSCIWYFPRLLVAICHSRNPVFSSPSSGIYLQPYDAEDIYLRWACVLVAQVFPQWLKDMQQSGMSDVSHASTSRQIARFRRGLLCAAALHAHVRVDDSCFELKEWSKYPKLCQGVFSLQEFLQVACETGAGLPYGEPHTKARAGGKDSEYSYSKFKSKLNRIRDMFRVDDAEKLKEFETCHLEWLAVFLSVPDWRSKTRSSEHDSDDNVGRRRAPFDSTCIAMDNLRSQLGVGMSGSQPGLFFSDFLTNFPLFKRTLHRTIWRNRNVLEASLHIDNMLALSAGDHFREMLKMKTLTSERITSALTSTGISDMKQLYSVDKLLGADQDERFEKRDQRRETRIPFCNQSSRGVDQLLYKLVGQDPETALFEQRITFLGCGMEYLRSALAAWVGNNLNVPDSVWRPSLEDGRAERQQPFCFLASNKFARCLGRKNWSLHLGDRHVQMRLLWELQNYFHGLIPDEGISPERHEAIVMCLLFFPSIDFSILEDNRDSGLLMSDTPDGVSIGFHMQRQDVRVILSVPCGQQPVCISVQLELMHTRDIKISSIISGEGHFCWETWRNDFTNRLEELRQSQESNGLQFSPVIRTKGSVSRAVKSAEVIAFGTGPEMKVWPGWLPHRPTMCLFELESEGFIIQVKKKKLDLSFSIDWENKQSTGLSKSRRVPVQYATSNELDLEHASAVAQRVLMTMAEEDKAEHDLRLNGASALAEETMKNALASGKAEKEFRLRLSEAVAVHHQNFEVLENAVLYLCQNEESPEVLTRSAFMIESFCSLVGEPKCTFDMGAPGLRMEDKRTMARVLSLVEKLATEKSVSHDMCTAFVRICTSFESCDNLEMMEQAAALLLRKIISASHRLSECGMQALSRDLGSILGRMGYKHGPIALLLYSRFSEQGKLRWDFCGSDALYGTGGPASPTLAATLFSIGASEENDARCLRSLGVMYDNGYQKNSSEPVRATQFYNRAIDECGDVGAMTILARLLQNGAQGVCADPGRSVDLFSRAIEEGDDVNAMTGLANMLENGGHGVDANPTRAVDLYERAIDDGVQIVALNNLANILKDGAQGVGADPARAVELYDRAIDEGAGTSPMYNLALLLEAGAPGVDPEPARAASLFCRAIDEGAHVGAMYSLGMLLEEGAHGVSADPSRAADLYNRAIDEGGDLDAMNNLAVLLENGADGIDADPARAVVLYSRAIDEGGHIGSMNNLANLLQNGAHGVDADHVQAVYLYSRAIEEGAHVNAMNNLGILLSKGGKGVDADPVRAVDLYYQAIDKGSDQGAHIDAMCNLAALLSNGAHSVDADPALAVNLYNRAITEGAHVSAINRLVVLLLESNAVGDTDPAMAVRLYNRAIDEGDAFTMTSLAALFEHGAHGVEADPARAVDLYRRAIDEGADVDAMNRLAALLVEGREGVQADTSSAIELYNRAIEGGNVLAAFNLAELLDEGGGGVDVDPLRAVQLYRHAMGEGGDIDALCNLANLLAQGAEGVDVDPAGAVDICTQFIFFGDDESKAEAVFELFRTVLVVCSDCKYSTPSI